MKAVVKTMPGEGNIEIQNIEEPYPGHGEIKIEVKAAGICGTDIHIYHDEYPSNPPVVLGHEFCGIIAETGSEADKFNVGDRVVAEPAGKICGECIYCHKGHYNMCQERLAYGVNLNGGFTRYIVVREKVVHRLPDEVSYAAGALTEPLAVSTHAIIERTKISAGEVVVISGPGPVGLLASQVAKAEGGIIVVCGRSEDEKRLTLASQLGADYVVNIQREDPEKIIKDLTNGYGADVAIEVAGVEASIEQCLKLVKRDGKIIQLGLFGKPIKLNYDQIVFKEIRVIGSIAHYWGAFEKALQLVKQKKVSLDALVSDRLTITEWQKGFTIVEEKKGVKVILMPVD